MTLRVLLLWKVISVFILSVVGEYDCRKEGMTCHGGTCIQETGICTGCDLLTPSRQGYDCGLVSGFINGGDCTATYCENGGTCYTGDDNITSCYCLEDFYGATCSYKRYEALSDTDKMVISINPLPGFSGLIYISGHMNVTSCLLLPVPSPPDAADDVPDHWQGYYGVYPHTGGECGDAWANSTTKIRHVTIQYKNNYLTGLDLQVTLTSTLDPDGVDVHAASFAVSADELLSNQNVIRSTFNPVTMTTTTLDGAPLSDSGAAVGVVVVFVFSVPVNDFSALRLETVIANNSLSGDSADSITLVTGGCVDRSVLSVVEEVPGPPDSGVKSTIWFKLRTFKFLSSDVLALMFVVKVCIVDTDCDQPSCLVTSRSRRSLDQDETVLNKVLRVMEPQGNDPGSIDPERPPTEEDTGGIVFTATVTSEAVLLALFTVLLLVLVTRCCRRRKPQANQHTQTDQTIYPYFPLR